MTEARRGSWIRVLQVLAAFAAGIGTGAVIWAVPADPTVHARPAAPSDDDGSSPHHEADASAPPVDDADVGHDHGARDVAAVWAGATDAERTRATDLIAATRAAAARYADVNVALAEGFRPNPRSSGVGLVHYPNDGNRRDRELLEPNALEGLVYHVARDGRTTLVGALYTAGRGPLPPAPGGDITRWHSHAYGCAHPTDAPSCAGQVPLYMLHVWLLDGVDDPFGDSLVAAFGGRRVDVRRALAASLPT